MTGDTKKNVENKGAATEQVPLNKWCHPKEVRNMFPSRQAKRKSYSAAAAIVTESVVV